MSASAWIQCLIYARCTPTGLGGCCAPSGRLVGDSSHRMSLRPGTCARHRRARGHIRPCNASYALRHLESAYSVGQDRCPRGHVNAFRCRCARVLPMTCVCPSMRWRACLCRCAPAHAESMRWRACRIDALARMPNRCAGAHAESMRWRACRCTPDAANARRHREILTADACVVYADEHSSSSERLRLRGSGMRSQHAHVAGDVAPASFASTSAHADSDIARIVHVGHAVAGALIISRS